MFTYCILLCLTIGVQYSENEQISVQTKQSFNSININVRPPNVGQTSLAIIFDCTGSMSNLEEMRRGAKRLVDTITERPDNPIFNYIFVCFRDPGASLEYYIFINSDKIIFFKRNLISLSTKRDIESAFVTTEKQDLLDVLNEVIVGGGGDCPEMTMGGILEGMKYVMDKSYVYIFTDATSKDNDKANEVLNIIQKKQATVSFFVTDDCTSIEHSNFSVFKELAVHSNGEFYDLNTKDIGKVMDDFKDTIDTRLTTLTFIYEAEGKNNTIDLTVDSTLEQLFVSVAGTKSVIEIFDPQNQLINPTNMLKLDNLSKVKVDHPDSGQWLILVGASSPHTIKITGISNITFTFGFSLNLPDRIENTVLNPIKDVKNTLVISPSNPNLMTNLTSVNITSSNESLTLILKGINNEINETVLYATEPFRLPILVFKIHIYGFDKHEKEMERLISTSIEAKEKSPPFIEIALKKIVVKEGDHFSIKCHVRSVLPITVKWMKNSETLLADEFDQSEILEYVIEKSDISDAGEYVCSAENEKGTSDEIVQVSIEPSQLLVNIPQFEYSKAENESIEIPCIVISSKNYSLTWFHNKERVHYQNEYELLGDNLLIKKLSRNNEGSFICEVMEEDSFLPKVASTFLKINEANEDTTTMYDDTATMYGDTTTMYDYTTTMYDNTSRETCSAKGKPLLSPERITRAAHQRESQELEIKRFDQLHLICPFEYYETILWYKQGRLIKKIETKDCIHYENDALHFNHTRYDDRGEYTCTAENPFGHSNYTYRINIVWPPKILFPSYDSIKLYPANLVIKVPLNQELKLNCVVDSNPKSEIMWVKADNSVVNGNNLHIEKVTIKERGIYRCIARNDYGLDDKYYDLEIIESRPKKKNDVENRKFILEGNDLFLDCQIEGYPVVSYTWFYNGEIVSNNSKYLRKNSVQTKDKGWYKCLARNKFGWEENTFSVQVYDLPKITYINGSQTINAFDKLKLECTAKGIPLPFILWKLNDEVVLKPSYDIYKNLQSGQKQFLIDEKGEFLKKHSLIPPMLYGVVASNHKNEINLKIVYSKYAKKNAGKYICHVVSYSGRDEKFVEIEVNSNPISRRPKIYGIRQITITEGMRLTLQCPTHRNATLSYLWRKNKKNIDNRNRRIYFTKAREHLIILRANFNDTGIYECFSFKQNYAEKVIYDVSVLQSSKLKKSVRNEWK